MTDLSLNRRKTTQIKQFYGVSQIHMHVCIPMSEFRRGYFITIMGCMGRKCYHRHV